MQIKFFSFNEVILIQVIYILEYLLYSIYTYI